MKKQLALFAMLITAVAAFAQQTVQVVMPEGVNLPGSEAAWLPGQVQDKLKSNLQEYLGMRTVVDSASEAKVKRLQRESEGSGRDENAAIELGKISTAQFAVFTRIRMTGKGYTISADYTDLTTGVQRATAASKEYKSAGELYENTGAIDEITLILAEKLNIAINPIQTQALKYGTADFSIDEQLRLARQNEEQYKKMMSQFDEQLRALAVSNDLNAVENTKKIEAEKALLAEKQQSEQRRLAELAEQKKKADEDALLEAQRSEEQKKKRDSLSAQAAAKAAEVRRLKMEKQGVFGQINVIESKKKALVEIRQSVEARIQELSEQTERDKADEKQRIINKGFRAVDYDAYGAPIPEALQRQRDEISDSNIRLEEKFKKEAKEVRDRVAGQEGELLKEIRNDQQKIKEVRTVSSLGDELKVSYGSYIGTGKVWKAYFSLYSDGILLDQGDFELEYRAVAGKPAPGTSSGKEYDDYADTVDMYSSLFLRGDPILYYEIDYTVSAAPDYEPSKYTFTFQTLRVQNTSTGKTVQAVSLHKSVPRTMQPAWDIRTEKEIADYIQAQLAEEKKQARRAEEPVLREKSARGSRVGASFGGSGSSGEPFGLIQVDFVFSWTSWLYSGLVLDIEFGSYGFDSTIFNFISTIGVNWGIPLGRYRPVIYSDFGIGGGIVTAPPFNKIKNPPSELMNLDLDDDVEDKVILRYALGIEFPLFDIFRINLQYALKHIPDYSHTPLHEFTLGMRVGASAPLFNSDFLRRLREI